MLEVDHIAFTYPSSGASIRANFTVANGTSAALMGPSGVGKSTILNLIAGFLHPNAGNVCFANKSLLAIPPAERPLTYLFQAHNLFPHLTIRQNLALGLHPGMQLSPAQSAMVEQALEWVSLTPFAARKPLSLSGGQQQRGALARCLVRNRPLLLLDEPFTGLDEDLRAEMIAHLLALQQMRACTLLFTTHQSQDATALGATVIRL